MKLKLLLQTGLLACLPVFALADPLLQQFASPPQEARPLTWWHWLNGNVDQQGISLDLNWMKSAGLGGFQLFDGSLLTPQIVKERAPFLSEAWKRALLHTAQYARQQGLGMSITTSPGWSAAGGPWVKPEQSMKKLVWSKTQVQGGRLVHQRLEQPPSAAGAYQNLGSNSPDSGFYAPGKVLAYKVPVDELRSVAVPDSITSSVSGLEAATFWKADLAKPQALAYDSEERLWLRLDYRKAQTVRAVTLGLPSRSGFGAPTPPTALLQSSEDGEHWQQVAHLAPSRAAERTASFAAVTARHFRVLLTSTQLSETRELPKPEPGVVGPPFPPAPKTYNVSSIELHSQSLVHHFQEKAGFAAAADYYALDTPVASADSLVSRSDIIDVTEYMDAQGVLNWDAPAGNWQVLRMGYSLTGHRNGPASAEATGLEVDKLDARRVRQYFDDYLGIYRQVLGENALGEQGFIKGLLADSIESGPQNWTDDMLEQFRRLRGYEPVPWLPALTGVIVESAASSDRFLWDFRKTIADLVSEQYYGEIAKIAKEHGMTFSSEALEDHRPQLGDDITMRSHASVPMGALWTLPEQGYGKPTYLADILGAASVAHVYGQNLTGAEIFGAFLRPWDYTPRDLKRTADLALALGVNVFSIHTSIHQPAGEARPGLALAPFLGQAFTRHETWANNATPWLDYLARSAYLLRQGKFQADIAYFYGEEAPLTSLYGDGLPVDLVKGYGFDFVGADALQRLFKVEEGSLVTASGMQYRVLYLGGSSQRMTLATLTRIHDLVSQGATLIGQRPVASPALSDDPQRFTAVADQLWPAEKTHTRVGKGQVLAVSTLQQGLKDLGITPDVETAAQNLWSQHRVLDDGSDLYFFSNQLDHAQTVKLSLRSDQGRPELWRADEGCAYELAAQRHNGRTLVELQLQAHDAVFVVMRRGASYPLRQPVAQYHDFKHLDGAWTLSFNVDGQPQSRLIHTLGSWTQDLQPALRYFSGTVTYQQRFNLGNLPKDPVFLDLGDVRDMASVRLNGQPLGLLWKPPYRVDVSEHLKSGDNLLEVDVTNPWKNRLIGDAQPGVIPTTQTYGKTYNDKAALRPAGLLTPLRLVTGELGKVSSRLQ